MTDVPLYEYASVTLDANGNGTAQLGPISARERWLPTNVHVSATSTIKEATCSIYVGTGIAPNTFRGGTSSGSTGDTNTDMVDEVPMGSYIFAVWAAGDAGAIATITVTGTKRV